MRKTEERKTILNIMFVGGVSASFVFVASMEALYDDTHIKEYERSKKIKNNNKKKERKKNVVIIFHLNLNIVDSLKGSSRAN